MLRIFGQFLHVLLFENSLYVSVQLSLSYLIMNQMSIRQPEKIGPYFFVKTTFKLLNLEINPSFSIETSALSSIYHLSRFLKYKKSAHRTSQILNLKQTSKGKISYINEYSEPFWKGMDEILIRTKDQLERVRSLMHETQIKNKHSLKNKNSIEEQKFKQMMQDQGRNKKAEHLCAYFQQLGQLRAGKLAQELQLYGQSCESYYELLQTFRHIIIDDEPSTIFSNTNAGQKKVYFNIREYGELFQQIIALRQKRGQANNHQVFLDDYSELKLPKSIENNQFYKSMESQLKQTMKKHKSIGTKYIFSDLQRFIRFLEMQPVNEERFESNGPLIYEMLWEKLDYLIRKGPIYHDMIGIHLLQFKQNELCNFFKATLSGKFQSLTKNILLFDSNSHYQNFVRIIERTYSEELIRQNRSLSKDEIAGVIKELILRINLKENVQNQLKLIRQYAFKLSEKLKFKVQKVSSCSQIKAEIKQLICLGEISPLVEIMVDSHKMNSIQALLLLSRLINVNLNSSDLLFFNSQPAQILYSSLLQKTLKIQGKLSYRQMTSFMKVFVPFLPFERVPSSEYLRNMLTYNKSLFEYIIQNSKFSQYFAYYNFTFSNFSQILQASMLKHSNYAYCAELALSFLIPLSQYIQICYPRSKSHKFKSPNQGNLNYISDEFHCKQLQRHQFDDKDITFSQRFKLLICMIKYFQKVNVLLSKNKAKRQTFYEQINFCNQMFLHLSKKTTAQILWRNWDIAKSQQNQIAEQLTTQLVNLTFTFSLLRIRNCIFCSKFEEMVELFNQFLQKIAPHFRKIIADIQNLLQEDQAEVLGLKYLREITQCLLIIKRNKIKVISKNRYLFKVLCSNISELLKEIKEVNREDVQLIEEQLKQIANEIISL